jgi:hypothetical protein
MGFGKYLFLCCTSILSYALIIYILYLTVNSPTNADHDLAKYLTNKTFNKTVIEPLNETVLFALNETIAQNEFNSSLLNSTDNE